MPLKHTKVKICVQKVQKKCKSSTGFAHILAHFPHFAATPNSYIEPQGLQPSHEKVKQKKSHGSATLFLLLQKSCHTLFLEVHFLHHPMLGILAGFWQN